MKDARDPGTAEMTLAPKRGRGRPCTGNAKSAAERMREYRLRNVTVNRDVLEAALPSFQDEPVAGGPESVQIAALEGENAELRQRIAEMERAIRVVAGVGRLGTASLLRDRVRGLERVYGNVTEKGVV